ncbi:MAG: hypothetical protein H7A37_09030 [Chlamydiales bacterium]|nr:hypothetical protein [Chlamydiales bacterium]
MLEQDPWESEKKIAETFSLFLVPDKVLKDGKLIPVTIDNIPKIRRGIAVQSEYGFYSNSIKKPYGSRKTTAHWVLMRKLVIPESRTISFESQKRLLDGKEYEVPKLLDVIMMQIIYNVVTDNGGYSEDKQGTSIRCRETVKRAGFLVRPGFYYQALVTSKDSKLLLHDFDRDNFFRSQYSLLPCWKFQNPQSENPMERLPRDDGRNLQQVEAVRSCPGDSSVPGLAQVG